MHLMSRYVLFITQLYIIHQYTYFLVKQTLSTPPHPRNSILSITKHLTQPTASTFTYLFSQLYWAWGSTLSNNFLTHASTTKIHIWTIHNKHLSHSTSPTFTHIFCPSSTWSPICYISLSRPNISPTKCIYNRKCPVQNKTSYSPHISH